MRVIGGITDANGSRCFYIMDDNLKLFENPDFGDVRVLLDEKNNPWFVGNDIAKCLGYENLGNAVKGLLMMRILLFLQVIVNQWGLK